METPQEFTARALGVQNEAIRLSIQLSDGYTELNRWMIVAKQSGMTWVDGLAFSVGRMKAAGDASSQGALR